MQDKSGIAANNKISLMRTDERIEQGAEPHCYTAVADARRRLANKPAVRKFVTLAVVG